MYIYIRKPHSHTPKIHCIHKGGLSLGLDAHEPRVRGAQDHGRRRGRIQACGECNIEEDIEG